MVWGSDLASILGGPGGILTRAGAVERDQLARFALPPVVVGATLVLVDLSAPALPGGGAFLLLLLPVALCSICDGRRAGLVALVLATAGALVLVPVRGHPWLSSPLDVARLVLYLAVGVIVISAPWLRTTVQARPIQQPTPTAVGPSALIEPLTPRELEVLRLAARGESVEAIGRRLYLSRNTVKSHLAHAYGKLGAHNRAEAIAAGLHAGCLDPAALAGER